jgi:site-specific recombinase XerD
MGATSERKGIRERYGRWEYRFMVAGQKVQVLTDLRATKRNLATARRLRDEHRQQVLEMKVPLVGAVSVTEAAEHFVHWSEMEHREHPNTARRQAVSMASIKEFLGYRRLAQITVGDLENFKTWRRENDIKEVTIRHDLLALSQLFQLGQRHGWCPTNPVRDLKLPSDEASRNETVLSDEEEKKYFKAAARHQNLFDVGRLMILQGLRPEEVMSLPKNSVDLEEQTVRVRRGKSRAAKRRLALTAESLLILGRRMAGSSCWLFPSRRRVWHRRLKEFRWVEVPSRHITYSGLVKAHNQALEESELSFNLYSLRHTFATRLYGQTKDLEALRRILGHADLKTVMRYVHVGEKEIREAMKKYEEGLKPLEIGNIQ